MLFHYPYNQKVISFTSNSKSPIVAKNPKRTNTMKRKIGDIFIQIIPVMIGVYLGFVVSNWADGNKRNQQVEIFIENLYSEIESNERKINSVIEYHKMVRDSSRHFTNPVNNITKPTFFQGTRTLKLTNSAYNTGIQTGIINNLKINQIQEINQLYTLQNDYNDFGNLMLSGLISIDLNDTPESIMKVARFLGISMTDVVIKEQSLLEGYSSIKLVLKEEK